ncbi:hypothetical protein FRC02_005080 [Tulasnella sp. 418]|nr:hypothetical protein FRC02_005080 [Tulasnella sp. 418]
MSGRSWVVSIALGFVSLPLGFLIRCIPNGPVEKLFIKLRIMRDPNVLPVDSPESQQRKATETVWKSRSRRLHELITQFPYLRMVLSAVMTVSSSAVGLILNS